MMNQVRVLSGVDLMTSTQLAKLLRVNPKTVLKWVKLHGTEGEDYVRLGHHLYIKRSSVGRLLGVEVSSLEGAVVLKPGELARLLGVSRVVVWRLARRNGYGFFTIRCGRRSLSRFVISKEEYEKLLNLLAAAKQVAAAGQA